MEGLGPEIAAQLATVPRGNTQKHVNRDVLAYLLRHQAARLSRPLRWLDLPCGSQKEGMHCGCDALLCA